MAISSSPAARAQNANIPKTVLPSPQPSFPSKNLSREVIKSSYIVGPEDVLSITVVDMPQFSVAQAVVPQNGLVTVPVVGTLFVTGKTLEKIDAEITKGLRARLRKPEVDVTLVTPRPHPLYVVGQVKNPGIFEDKDSWRITQALGAAGGLAVDSDFAAVTITRGNKSLLDTAIAPLLKDPANANNILLQSGDTLRFYERKYNVSVTGSVSKPGIYAVPYGSGVAQAIALAGGSTASAALTRATLRHQGGQALPVNLYKAIVENDAASNLPLGEGDIIDIPEQKDRVSVLGAVSKPGFFPMEDGRDLKLSDAIAAAGGAKPNAALTRTVVRRSNGDEVTVDLYQLLVKGNQENDLVLRPDDIISIPEMRGITVIGEVGTPGTYPLDEGKAPRISDALAVAGGLKIKPEEARISISRSLPGGKSVTINADAVGLLKLSDPAQNAQLQDGDILSVASVKQVTVFISGEVKIPGAYDLSEGGGISELIVRAGGPTSDAALTQVSVSRRDGKSSIVDTASALLVGGRQAGGPLTDGDIVVVPRSKQRILVVGAVTKPGSYALAEDYTLTIGDALSLAGGPSSSARVKTLTLLRPNGNTVERSEISIDQAQKGVLGVNFLVKSGDVIYVPEGKPRQSTLDTVSRFLPGLAYLLN